MNRKSTRKPRKSVNSKKLKECGNYKVKSIKPRKYKKSARKSMRKSRKSSKKSDKKDKNETRCKNMLKDKIKINMEEFKDGRYNSRSQAIAVSYAQVNKTRPSCKKYFSKDAKDK